MLYMSITSQAIQTASRVALKMAYIAALCLAIPVLLESFNFDAMIGLMASNTSLALPLATFLGFGLSKAHASLPGGLVIVNSFLDGVWNSRPSRRIFVNQMNAEVQLAVMGALAEMTQD